MDRDAVLRAALSPPIYGTPFHHQGRLPGVGLDCIGLVDCAMAAAGIRFRRAPTDYERVSDGVRILRELEERCEPIRIEEAAPADILAFAFVRGDLQHLALVSWGGRMVHTWSGSGKVIEQDISTSWRNRLISAWRVREAA